MTDTFPAPGDRLRAALTGASTVAPDEAAAAQNRARALGAPRTSLVGVPQQQWPQPRQDFDVEGFLAKYPSTSRWLSDQANAQVAHDPQTRLSLGSIEQALRTPVDPYYANPSVNSRLPDTLSAPRRSGSAGQWLRGLATAVTSGEAWQGTQLALGDALNLWSNPSERAAMVRDQAQETARVEAARPETNGAIASGVYGGLESAARMVPGLALSAILRNPAPLLATAGVGTGAEAYGKYSVRGATPGEAALGAIGEGSVEVLTEMIPMGKLVGALGADGAKKFITELGKSALAEIPGEQIATLAQDAIDTAIANPDKTWGDYLKERPDAAAQTLVATLTQTALMSGAAGGIRALGTYADRQATQAAQVETDASVVESLLTGAASSPLRTRSSESFKDFVASAAEGGPVSDLYISAEALNQSGVDVGALRAAVPAIDQQLAEATNNGGDIRIPVEQLLAQSGEVEGVDSLVDHVRINPALPSRAEVSALTADQGAQLQAEAAQVLADATTQDAFRQSAERVETGVFDQLQTAGRFTRDVNKGYASLVGSFYTVQAQRLGITPEQMAERYPLKITAELPQATRETTLDQAQPETVNLIHFSRSEGLVQTDPTRWGSNRATPQGERARVQSAPGRTYFYDRSKRVKPEAAIQQTAPFRYAAEALRSTLYDFDADPQNLRPTEGTVAEAASAYENAIREAGFAGYRSDAVVPGTVAIFDAIPLRSEGLVRTVSQAQAVTRRQQELQHQDRMARVAAKTDPNEMVLAKPLEAFRAQALADVFADSATAPISGAPKSVLVDGKRIPIVPFAPAREAAIDYMASRGLRYEPPTEYVKVDVQRATRFADAFDLMDHNPDDPLTRASYSAMIEEALAQYQFVKATGLEIEFIAEGQADPYAASPRLAIQDVVENNHLWVFPTDAGFGGTASADVDVSGNPLLGLVDEWIGDRQLRANDVFRIVHDYYGHVKDGFGFRADGEENAYQSHAAMFSPLARRAMATETRGQNSWVNYGPFAEFNKTANAAETQYAPQKIGLLPAWADSEGFVGGEASGTPVDQTFNQSEATKTDTPEFKAWFGPSKVVDKSGQPLVVYHGTTSEFEAFNTDTGAWFSEDRTLAAEYAADAEKVVPVYLAVENPIEFLHAEQRKTIGEVISTALEGTAGSQDLAAAKATVDRLRKTHGKDVKSLFEFWRNDPDVSQLFRDLGYDGIKVFERGDRRSATWAALSPAQIKSTENRGTFDAADPRILYQAEEVRPHPAFYSALLRAVAKAPQAKASAAQWKATLAKTAGVKKDEIEWSSLNEWLDMATTDDNAQVPFGMDAVPLADSKGNISREQIVAFLENGGVQVEETLLGSPDVNYASPYAHTMVLGALRGASDREDAIMQLENDGDAYRVLKTRNPELFVEENGDDVEDWAGVVVDDVWRPSTAVDGPAQFGTYKLSGADDTYRELLLTLPRIDGPSTHWDQPNVVAHTRFTTRTDASGARVLFLEEMQSDWHQKGRDEGYAQKVSEEARAAAEERYNLALNTEREARQTAAQAAKPRLEELEAFYSAEMQTPGLGLREEDRIKRARANVREGLQAFEDAGASGFTERETRLVTDAVEGVGNAPEKSADLQTLVNQVTVARLELVEANIALDAARGYGIPDAPFRTSWAQLVMKRMIAYAVENNFDKIAWINGNQQNGGQTGGDGSFFYERNLVNSTNDLLKKLGGRVEQFAVRDPAEPARMWDNPDPRPANRLGVQNGFTINDQMKAQASDGFALFQKSRGQIAFGQDITQTPSVISLLRTADLSTFLHETGHFFLEVTKDMAKREDAPAEIKADMDTLLSWFGVESIAAYDALPFERKRDFHEQFARGFEAYLMEGRAPTQPLRELFQRFRSWLLNVYRSFAQLNVELTDDVRQVMDRMVAAQDEIADTQADYGFIRLTERPPYMDAASWADYQGAFEAATEEGVDTLATRSVRDMKWLSNARSRALKALQAQARTQRQTVKAEVTAEVMSEPVNVARTYLRRGIGPDGEPVAGALKLDTTALRAMYGDGEAAVWRGLRTGGKYGETQADGVHPDVAAEMLGYDSGDALVRDLVSAEPAQEKIAGLTDQRMLERYGDLSDAASLQRAADEAVANDAHVRAIATDYAALATATGQPRALAAATREYAARIVNEIPLKRLKPAQFFAAMTRAGKAADKAAKAGDLALAATQRRNQLINLQAAKYALKAQAEVDKGLSRFGRIVSAKDEALTKTRDMALVNAARAVLAAYGFGRVKNDPASYLEQVSRYDPQLYADIQPFVEGAQGQAKPLDLITFEQFQGLRDTVNQLWALSRRARQIELDGKLVDINVARDALGARLDELGYPTQVGVDQQPTQWQKGIRELQGARAALRRVESWARGIDGGDRGPFQSFIWRVVSSAADRYRVAQADYTRQFLALVEPIRGTLSNTKIAAPEIGYTFTGKAELLHAVLHSGNGSNQSKLLLGRRWGETTEDGGLNTSRWDAFVARAQAEGILTQADYDFAQGVWDLLESTKPAAQAAHRAMYGRYFSEVTADPITTPWGEYRGGYVPAATDAFMVQDAVLRHEQEALEDSNAFMFPAASNGFTKSRVQDYQRELSLDIRLLPMHLDKVLKFTHLGPPVRDVARLLKGKELAAKLDAYDPVAATDLLLPWLQRAARQVVSEPTKGWGGKRIDKFFRGARSRAGMQIMFGNVSNVLQQITAFSNAAVMVKPAKIGQGLWAYVRDPKGSRDRITNLSTFMQTRADAQVFEMRQSIDQILLDANALDKLTDFSARHAYFLQQALQNVTDAAIWHGAFNQSVERGDTDQEAIVFADGVIRQTQGSLNPEDVSRFETGTPFVRFFTQFYSYFNNQANLLGTEGLITVRDTGVKDGLGRLMYVYLMGFAIPALAGQAIADLMRGGWDDDEDDGYLDEFLNWFFMSQVKFGLAAVPIAGPAANAALGGFTPQAYDDRVTISPAISMFDSSLALPGKYYEAIKEGGGLKGRDVRDTFNMLGLISALPFGAIGRQAGYGYSVATGEVQPTDAVDATRGFTTGTASPESRGR